MKKIKYLIICLLGILLLPISVCAASGNIGVTGTSTVVVGNNVTVTVTLSSSTKIGSWQMNLKYDKNYLQLTNTTSEAGGTMMAASSTSGVTKKTYTFTFKTLKTGSTSVSVGSYLAYAFDDLSEMALSSSSKSIRIITQQELEASYSKNNDLANLTVEGFELVPEFNKDNLEYSVVVPEDTKEINIDAKVSDGKSSLNGIGKYEVTSGSNAFDVVVRAENGAEKTYKILVEVKDNNPINVTVNNNEYTVVKIREYLPTISHYEEYNVTINGYDIPAYKNKNTELVLVGLKNDAGDIELFIYDEKTQKYETYNEIGVNKLTIFPLNTDLELEGYTKTSVKIGDITVDGYSYTEDSTYAVIYGVNVETGENGFYLYDKENQVVSKYNDEYIKRLQENLKLYSYIIMGFSVLFVILLLIIIFRKPKRRIKKPVISEIEHTKEEINKTEEKKDDNDTLVNQEVITDEKESNISEEKENKREQKKLKKQEKKKKKAKKDEAVEKTEKSVDEVSSNDINDVNSSNEEEMYDLFEEDSKKKKRKK